MGTGQFVLYIKTLVDPSVQVSDEISLKTIVFTSPGGGGLATLAPLVHASHFIPMPLIFY